MTYSKNQSMVDFREEAAHLIDSIDGPGVDAAHDRQPTISGTIQRQRPCHQLGVTKGRRISEVVEAEGQPKIRQSSETSSGRTEAADSDKPLRGSPEPAAAGKGKLELADGENVAKRAGTSSRRTLPKVSRLHH